MFGFGDGGLEDGDVHRDDGARVIPGFFPVFGF